MEQNTKSVITNTNTQNIVTIINKENGKTFDFELFSDRIDFKGFKKIMNLYKLQLDIDTKHFAFRFRGKEYLNRDFNIIKFWIKDLFAPVLKLEVRTDEKKQIIKIVEKYIMTKDFKISYLNKDYKSNDELYNFVKNAMLEALDSLDDSYDLELVNEFKKCISK